MTWFEWHCAKCKGDWDPYVRPGDVISFFKAGIGNTVATVTKVDGAQYTVCAHGHEFTFTHGRDVQRVSIVNRPGSGLPATADEHVMYARAHHMPAPNLPDDLYFRVRDVLREEVRS